MSWQKAWSWIRATHNRADLGVTLAEVAVGTVAAVALLAVAAPMLVNTVAGWRLERSVSTLSHSLAAASHRHANSTAPLTRSENFSARGHDKARDEGNADAAEGVGVPPAFAPDAARDDASTHHVVERVAQAPPQDGHRLLVP
ncbi:MAG TPA: hypothetical protein VF265_00675 [Nevskiaceae bacterium]